MPQYQPKIDSGEVEVPNPGRSSPPPRGEAGADSTDLVVRLWVPGRPDRSAPLTWKTDSVLVYMIADLVCASRGRIAEESPAIMGAHFDGPRQALLAAKRIQTSILEFLACRPDERIGTAILLYRPRASDPEGFTAEMVRQALKQIKPGQVLLAENVSEHLRDLPGVEFRAIPAVTTVMGEWQPEFTELIWTTPDRVARLQVSVDDETEAESADIPSIGATVIVHSPLARQDSIRQGVAPERVSTAGRTDKAQGPASVFAEGPDEFEPRPFITRTRVLVGVLVVVLTVALIAVVYRPAQVSKAPIPLQVDQGGAREVPHQRLPAQAEPDVPTAQPESRIVKTEIAKPQKTSKLPVAKSARVPMAQQSQVLDKASADNRVKSQSTSEVAAPYSDESGGVSLKDIPVLLKMAQQDAGAGNYNKARTEYRKILGLQPNNQDARDGLHKLDIIQKDQQ
jgi:hypothetical protein